MLKELELCHHNLHILNYSFIFKKYVERNFINDFFIMKLNEIKKDSTARKLFVHHNILSVCEHILKTKKKGRVVLFFDFNNLLDSEITKYIDESKLNDYFKYVYIKIKTLLPIRIFYSSYSLEYLNEKLVKKDGLAIETFLKIKALSETHGFEKYTFEKCKKFVKKEGLTFLDTTYFNSLKSKQLLLV